MGESAPGFRRLPLAKVIWGAFSLSWQNRASLFRATLWPLLALIAVSLFWDLLPRGDSYLAQWLPQFIYLVPFSWLAVTVHRLVLLDEASSRSHLTTSSWKRVAVYVLAFATIGIFFIAAKFIPFNVIGIVTGINYVAAGAEPNLIARRWLDWGATIFSLLLISRLVLVLPSIAVDKGHELKDSWRMSRGNSWRLAVVYGVLPWALGWVRWLLYRDESSSFEVALIVVLGSLLAIVEIVALSLSYAALTADDTPSGRPSD
ncbi:MAG TPA: hypothetical protein VFU13_22140 [Steroidobacteraceae bacterium]|nr:hypothetical protein [Steroidobacteraceae bacterium]